MAVNCHCVIETQTMFEGIMPIFPKRSMKLKPSLETILEVSLQRENTGTESHRETEHHSQELREEIFLEEIPKIDEQLASSL